jgi:tight adherence protein B
MWSAVYAKHTVSELLTAFASVERSEKKRSKSPAQVAPVLSSTDVKTGAVIAGVSVGIGAVVKPLFGVVLFIALLVILRARGRRRVTMRLAQLERDLPTLLTSVASSVRAGVDPLVAVATAREFFPSGSHMQRELTAFAQGLASGRDEYEVIDNFMQGVESSEADLFKRCLSMSRRHGASLAEPLHRITKVIRQRQSFRRKTGAALAMHRLSAFGIALCATVVGIVQFVANAAAVRTALADSTGRTLLSVGGLLIVAGVWLMTRMGREERL